MREAGSRTRRQKGRWHRLGLRRQRAVPGPDHEEDCLCGRRGRPDHGRQLRQCHPRPTLRQLRQRCRPALFRRHCSRSTDRYRGLPGHSPEAGRSQEEISRRDEPWVARTPAGVTPAGGAPEPVRVILGVRRSFWQTFPFLDRPDQQPRGVAIDPPAGGAGRCILRTLKADHRWICRQSTGTLTLAHRRYLSSIISRSSLTCARTSGRESDWYSSVRPSAFVGRTRGPIGLPAQRPVILPNSLMPYPRFR